MAFKLRILTKFPALINAATGVFFERAGRTFTFMLDWLTFIPVDSIADPSSRYMLVVSGTSRDDQLYELIALDKFQASVAGLVQIITTSGAHDVDAATALVIVNPTVAGAVTLNMIAAAGKIGRATVIDWKQNAGTNNITVVRNGTEKFNGLSQDWVIATDGAASTFIPYPGQGYAVQ